MGIVTWPVTKVIFQAVFTDDFPTLFWVPFHEIFLLIVQPYLEGAYLQFFWLTVLSFPALQVFYLKILCLL